GGGAEGEGEGDQGAFHDGVLSCSRRLRVEGVAGRVVVDELAAGLVGGRSRLLPGVLVLRAFHGRLRDRGGGAEGEGKGDQGAFHDVDPFGSRRLRVEGVAGRVVVDELAAGLVGGRFRLVPGVLVLRAFQGGLGNRSGGAE